MGVIRHKKPWSSGICLQTCTRVTVHVCMSQGTGYLLRRCDSIKLIIENSLNTTNVHVFFWLYCHMTMCMYVCMYEWVYRPVVVEMCQLVRELLHRVRGYPHRVLDHVVVGRAYRALTHRLGHQEKIVPVKERWSQAWAILVKAYL